jgi:regulator of nucleoside diphosphate kinase
MNTLPDITITTTDRERLVSIATAALPSRFDGVAASMLLSEIARAAIVPPEALPSNVVGMGCEVEIRDNIKGTHEYVRIVFPGEEPGDGQTVSILTPLGAVLIGLCEGDSMEWCTAARDRKSLTVLRVRRRQQAEC